MVDFGGGGMCMLDISAVEEGGSNVCLMHAEEVLLVVKLVGIYQNVEI